jgi:hypothetical protein
VRRTKPCPGCGDPILLKSGQCKACQRTDNFPLSGDRRNEYGCIVTFEDGDGGRLTLHATGPAGLAVSGLCATALARDPSYRLISYSTPETIYGDMQGNRADIVGPTGLVRRQPRPEAQILGRIGRIDLLHPRFHAAPATARERDENRTARGRW